MNRKKSNCFGYALYKLGLQENDDAPSGTYSPLWLWRTFTSVRSFKNADAVLWGFGDTEPIHMAVADKKRKNYVIERPGSCRYVRRVSLKEAGTGYEGLSRFFLKLR